MLRFRKAALIVWKPGRNLNILQTITAAFDAILMALDRQSEYTAVQYIHSGTDDRTCGIGDVIGISYRNTTLCLLFLAVGVWGSRHVFFTQ